MNFVRMIRILPLLPVSWLSCCRIKDKSREARWACTRRWAARVLRWSGIRLHVYGADHLPENCGILFVSNHQGTLDPAVVVCAVPFPVSFVSKKENASIPVLGRWAQAIDTIHFDRSSRSDNIYMFREVIRRLKQKRTLLIFPEGTRSRSQQMQEFHPQALQPGVKARAVIVPVALVNAHVLDVSAVCRDVSVHFGKPYFPEICKEMSPPDLSACIQRDIQAMIASDPLACH